MASPSLRKMGRGRGTVEGNYASTNLLQSAGSSLNNDLGLTLFPGSQTWSAGETSGHTDDNDDRGSEQTTTGDEVSGEPSGHGKPSGSNAISTATEYGEGDVEANDAEWDDLRSHLSESLMKHDDRRQCYPEDPDPSRCSPITARNPEAVNSNASGKDQANLTKEQSPVRRHPLSIGNGVLGNQQSMPQGREYSRRSASASNLRKSRISAEESYENISHKQQPTTASNFQVIKTSGENNGAPLDTEGFCKCSVVLTLSTPKPPAELERSESPTSVTPNLSPPSSRILPSNSTASSSTFNISSGSCQQSSRPRVLVSRSWTSHFPRASKFLQAKRYAKPPAPSSAAASSLLPHPHHHRGQQIRHDSTPPINQIPSILDNFSSPFRESASKVVDCAPAISSGFVPTRHLRHPTHRRTKSLPNLSSKHQLPNMELTHNGGSSSLITPPRSARSKSSGPPSSSVHFAPDQIGADRMNTSNTVFNASTHPAAHGLIGPPSMLSSQSVRAANLGRPSNHFQYQCSSNFSNIAQISNGQEIQLSTPRPLEPFSGAVHSNGNGIPVLQQPGGSAMYRSPAFIPNQWQNNNQAMPAGRPYSGPGTEALNNGPVPSQSFSQSNPAEANFQTHKNIQSHSSLQNPIVPSEAHNGTLRQQLEESLRQQDQLRGSIHWHEQGGAFQLNSWLLHSHNQMVQRISILERENQQLKSAHALLLSEMQKFAGRPMTNERTAHNILQNHRQNTDPPNGVHNQRAISRPTTYVPTELSNPSGPGSSSQAASFMDASGNFINTFLEPPIIDLTDGSSQSSNVSDNFTSVHQGSPLHVHEPLVNGTVVGQAHQSSPVKSGRDTHSTGSPGSKTSNDLPKRSPKSTKDVIRAAKSLSPAQREQIQDKVLASKQAIKPAKQAQYGKKSNQKKTKEAVGSPSSEASQASPSAQRKEKQPRKSAKAQKRAEQNQKALAQGQRQVTQEIVDQALEEKGTNDNTPAPPHAEEPTSTMQVDSLFGDGDHQNPEGLNGCNFDDAEFAAQMEAELTADAQTVVETDTNQGSTMQVPIEAQASEENARGDISDEELLAMLQAANAGQFEENQEQFEWAVSPGHELVDFPDIEEGWRRG